MGSQRGLFIVLEGCDRAGKTTQCNLLLSYFQSLSQPCELIKFPDRTTTLGKMINNYLQGTQDLSDQAIHLLFSANRWEKIDGMKRKLEAGIDLIVDRYAYSGVAFTAAKGLDINWCQSCDVGLIVPDLVLFLDTNTNVMVQRKDFGGERYENLEFQTLVREKFLALKDNTWKVIDASLSIEKVQDQIKVQIKELVNRETRTSIKMSLWEV